MKRRMMTGRALHLFDLVSYLNSADIHCCIRYPAALRMGSRTQVTFTTFRLLFNKTLDYGKPAAEEMFSSCFFLLVVSQRRLVVTQILPTCFILKQSLQILRITCPVKFVGWEQ